MPRVVSLYLPFLPTDRLRQRVTSTAPLPERRSRPSPPPIEVEPNDCSAPRGGGWRPGARWAQEPGCSRVQVEAQVAELPVHQRPPTRELGRRSEAAEHPFRAARAHADEGSPASALGNGAAGPAPDQAPVVTAQQNGQRMSVVSACRVAHRLGVSPGMALTHARALVPELDVHDATPELDSAVLDRLANYGVRRWAPTVAVDAPDGLLIDLTGSAHLHGGETVFAKRLVRLCRRAGYDARAAVAETVGAAHALARFGADEAIVLPRGGEAQALAGLPIAALRLDSASLDVARRLGLERIADVIGLPRAPLARRFGTLILRRLDQAVGREREPVVGVAPIETPVAELRLFEPVGTAEAIEQVTADLARLLAAGLAERGLGARSLLLTAVRVDQQIQELVIGLARASRDAAHFARLLAMRTDRIEPGEGLEMFRLAAVRTEQLASTNIAASLSGEQPAADLATLVDQLAGRVGSGAIYRHADVERDVPERSVRRADVLQVPAHSLPPWTRPVRLLRQPELLQGVVALLPDAPPRRFRWRGRTHVVVRGDGPERIYGEWWRRDGEVSACRDYYRVEDEEGGRYWLFRRGDGVDPSTGDLSWHLHGLFG